MVTSYMLIYENAQNPYEMRRNAITKFINKNTSVYVSEARICEISNKAKEIMMTGVKYKDACHVACALAAGCDYFISTDIRLLKYKTDDLKMINPVDFVKELEEGI
jgi:predicted nucleic acid-binding protein